MEEALDLSFDRLLMMMTLQALPEKFSSVIHLIVVYVLVLQESLSVRVNEETI